jgi:hypothetical protein
MHICANSNAKESETHEQGAYNRPPRFEVGAADTTPIAVTNKKPCHYRRGRTSRLGYSPLFGNNAASGLPGSLVDESYQPVEHRRDLRNGDAIHRCGVAHACTPGHLIDRTAKLRKNRLGIVVHHVISA